MIIRTLISVVATLALSSLVFAGQFDYARYKPARMSDIIAKGKAERPTLKGKEVDLNLVAGGVAYRVMLRYCGSTRAINPKTWGFIVLWLRAHGMSESFANLFENEACFQEGNTTYWLPIQTALT